MSPRKPTSKKIRSQARPFAYVSKASARTDGGFHGMKTTLLVNGRRASSQGDWVRVSVGDRIFVGVKSHVRGGQTFGLRIKQT